MRPSNEGRMLLTSGALLRYLISWVSPEAHPGTAPKRRETRPYQGKRGAAKDLEDVYLPNNINALSGAAMGCFDCLNIFFFIYEADVSNCVLLRRRIGAYRSLFDIFIFVYITDIFRCIYPGFRLNYCPRGFAR